ncbi:hypothetical protein OBBRIDRAFT_842635 [Obba rivulosa]|uniref:Uncharacterized protein n=1 Tax=Obba rivulosa TaxID=1052685 RepID=A0A8E2AW81_9APHY|nr:hypothetical protein OBBRIDRAFT_842635 [Obba rivulosa]
MAQIWLEASLASGRECLWMLAGRPRCPDKWPSGLRHSLGSSGGKHRKHFSILDCKTIGAVSYVAVQVFELSCGRTFRTIPEVTLQFRTFQYAHLPASAFLCMLGSTPELEPYSGNLMLTGENGPLFNNSASAITQLRVAAKLFRQCEENGHGAGGIAEKWC